MLVALAPAAPIAAQTVEHSEKILQRAGSAAREPAKVEVGAGEVKARIGLLQASAPSGANVGVIVDFEIAPGWHVYGKPVPEEYTPIKVVFDSALLSGQRLDFPKPTPVNFALLGETLPVFQGNFKAHGNVLLRQDVAPGEQRLSGTLSFQECNDNLCKMPQEVRFAIPLRIEAPPLKPG